MADASAAFDAQVAAPGVTLRRPALGAALEVPLLPNQAAADLLVKLRVAKPFPLGAGRWRCFPVQGDFNETADRALWRDAMEGRPLWKGESFDQFDPRGTGERPCPTSAAALKKARKPRPGAGSVVADKASLVQRREAVSRSLDQARVAFRDVTNRTNSRTVIAALVPPRTFLTNKAPYLAFIDRDPLAEAVCLGVLNSLCFDWQARRFVEISLNFFILEGLRVPGLDDATFAAIATAGARLSSPDERFVDFAATTGVDVGPLSEEERAALRVEIDARVAHAWKLTRDDLETVFADFTLTAVPPDYRERVRTRFAALR